MPPERREGASRNDISHPTLPLLYVKTHLEMIEEQNEPSRRPHGDKLRMRPRRRANPGTVFPVRGVSSELPRRRVQVFHPNNPYRPATASNTWKPRRAGRELPRGRRRRWSAHPPLHLFRSFAGQKKKVTLR